MSCPGYISASSQVQMWTLPATLGLWVESQKPKPGVCNNIKKKYKKGADLLTHIKVRFPSPRNTGWRKSMNTPKELNPQQRIRILNVILKEENAIWWLSAVTSRISTVTLSSDPARCLCESWHLQMEYLGTESYTSPVNMTDSQRTWTGPDNNQFIPSPSWACVSQPGLTPPFLNSLWLHLKTQKYLVSL